MSNTQELIDGVLNGDIDPLKAFIQLKAQEQSVKGALAIVKSHAVEKASTYGEKTFKAFGAEVQCKSAAGRWDFKHIEPIIKLKEQVKDYEGMAKDAYKLIEKGRQVIDENGEVVEPAKYTPGEDIISIKL